MQAASIYSHMLPCCPMPYHVIVVNLPFIVFVVTHKIFIFVILAFSDGIWRTAIKVNFVCV
jgi:hypothetical protein